MDAGSFVFLLIIASPFLILCVAGTWKLFQKAGEKGWKALVPFYSSYVMLKISGRPGWWLIWLFLPVASWIVSVGIVIDFIKCYGKFSIRDRAAAVLLPFIYLPKWGFETKTVYLGRSAPAAFGTEFPKSTKPHIAVQWGQGLFFAIFTAVFIRAFFVEFYVIPTASMERTLLVGDNILVSKLNYGARIPMTPISYPFANHTFPSTNLKAYWDILELPYLRLPGFSSVKRGDVLVFNYPHDTIDNRPVDKKEFYIKRCEALPGDTLLIDNARVYVNGQVQPEPKEAQFEYKVDTAGLMNPDIFRQLHITLYDGHLNYTMTRQSAATLRTYSNIKSVTQDIAAKGLPDEVFPRIFPPYALLANHVPDYKWNVDNMGPIIIPKKGWTVKLDSMTFPLYERAIEVYERNKVHVEGRDIVINGKKTDTYTFKMDYYWVIGDNWYDSEDSRYWGFVPEDHIGGKALFIWMSWDSDAPLLDKIRWDRFLKGIE
jgi:signal peptidase I